MPEILIIFFKRYNNRLQIINTNIKCPLEDLDMSKYVKGYDKNSYKYNLYAVSQHSGGLGGGHYWAYGKNNNNNWYKFDDTNVSGPCNPDDIINNNTYCLFYKKNK